MKRECFNKNSIRIFVLIALCIGVSSLFSQQGSASNPFTSLSSANSVTVSGVYYFNISGNTFNTYIESGGWILIATDQGSSSSTNLSELTSLNKTTRGILSSNTIALFSKMNQVRIQSSNNMVNATSTNDTVISRVKTFRTISRGVSDKSYNLSWSGTGANYLNSNSTSCNTNASTVLSATIYHPCGDPNAFHWLPILNFHTIAYSGSQLPNTEYFYLWAKVSASSLPVTWGNVNVESQEGINIVQWETYSEKNTKEFEVEYSYNAIDFYKIGSSVNAAGNSTDKKTYEFLHQIKTTYPLYYRIKQIDQDLTYDYSQKIYVKNNINRSSLDVNLFPSIVSRNKSFNILFKNEIEEPINISIFDNVGNSLLDRSVNNVSNNWQESFDLLNFSEGVYHVFIKTPTQSIFQKIIINE